MSGLCTRIFNEQWSDCIRLGNSNFNLDGCAYIIAACNQKYSKFTAEIAPQKGFDRSEEITLYIYGVCDEEQIFIEEYHIDNMTKNISVEFDISGVDELYISKVGDYSMGRKAGQYINEYSGMGVLMNNAILHK